MSRKLTVLVLALVVALAVAIPVLARDRPVTPHVQAISAKALAKAQKAQRTAYAAKRLAQGARRTARRAARAAGLARIDAGQASGAAADAKAAATEAKAAAGSTQEQVDASRVQTAFAPEAVQVGSLDAFKQLPDGPRVSVTVPDSGLIEVWAQVTISEAGGVSLYEDGQPMPGQAEVCGMEGGPGGLIYAEAETLEPLTLATPSGGGLPFCGSFGPPAPVLFQTTPGRHTYELRYGSRCNCGFEPPTFSERRLNVAPRR